MPATTRRAPLAIIAAIASLLALPVEANKAPPGPRKVLEVLEDVEESLVVTKYQHPTRVRRRLGEYMWDCSGMVDWVLRRAAPAASRAVGRPNGRRPLAVHFFRKVARIDPGKRRGPWLRVPDAASALPGDLIAWKRPAWFPSRSTGHVAFVVSRPRRNTGPVPGYLIRVADASKFKHEDDSRDPGVTGYGTGVLLLPTDRRDRPTGYGWVGSETRPEWVIPAELVIGRPLR